MMSEFCEDIGYRSINHYGEELCGDHVETAEDTDGNRVIVLADGLGSGVRASILATLTAKELCTMIAAGIPMSECVNTIVSTLPVSPERGVAYSTFTVIRLIGGSKAELIQFDNPELIFYRDGENLDYPKTEITYSDKKIYRSEIELQEGDIMIAMSDGCPHAGIGISYNFGWKREDIVSYMEPLTIVGYTAKTLATILLDHVDELYGHKPGDDATVAVVRVQKRQPMNILFGPPSNRDDCDKMMSLFFSKAGKHIICGGTTSKIAADYLGKEVCPSLKYFDKDIPPTATIEGVDLVTEGVITVNRVLTYAEDFLHENKLYEKWSIGKDGASKVSRLLFEEATDINFYVGRAINPAQQNPDLPINFSIKMKLVEDLTKCLLQMGKRVKTSYF